MHHFIYDYEYLDTDGNYSYIEISDDVYTYMNRYNGYGLAFEGTYRFATHEIRSAINLLDKIQINRFFYDDLSPQDLEYIFDFNEEEEYLMDNTPFDFSIGYANHFNSDKTLLIEYNFYQPFSVSSKLNMFSNDDVTKHHVSMAYYSNPSNGDLSYSLGFYNIYASSDEYLSIKTGMTFGLGIYILESAAIDLCLEIGRNKIDAPEDLMENYINLYIGLSTSDNWLK